MLPGGTCAIHGAMRKDDPSSPRPRRRKSAAPQPLELRPGESLPVRPARKTRSVRLDCDFGLALCLLPASLRGKRPASA